MQQRPERVAGGLARPAQPLRRLAGRGGGEDRLRPRRPSGERHARGGEGDAARGQFFPRLGGAPLHALAQHGREQRAGVVHLPRQRLGAFHVHHVRVRRVGAQQRVGQGAPLDRGAGGGERPLRPLEERARAGLQRRLARSHDEREARRGDRPALRRAVVRAGQRGHRQRHGRHVAREQADGVEAFAHHLHPRPVQRAEGRLVAHRAAIGRGADDAAGGLRPEGKMQQARRDAGRRAGGGAARRARRVARVGRGPREARGELRRHRLARHHRARPPRERHAGGIGARAVPGPDRRPVLRGQARGVEHVLHPEREAGERPGPARPHAGVHRVGLRAPQRRVEMGKGAQRRLAPGRAGEQRLGEVAGAQRAGSHAPSGFRGGKVEGVAGHAGQAKPPPRQPSAPSPRPRAGREWPGARRVPISPQCPKPRRAW